MYSVRRTVQRDRFCHVDNGASRGTITGEIARSYQTKDARNIDNPAAVSVRVWVLIEHLPRRPFAAKEYTLRIHLLYVIPQVLVGIPDRL
jgi:hypothetical protein